MIRARPEPSGLAPALAGQERLFVPEPPQAPSFDELCPLHDGDQLELEVAAAIRAGNQTTIHDLAAGDA